MSVNVISEILKTSVEILNNVLPGIVNVEEVEETEDKEPIKEENYESLSKEDFKRVLEAAATDENGLIEFIEKNGIDAAFSALDENSDGNIQADEVSKALGSGSSGEIFSTEDLVNAVVKKAVEPSELQELQDNTQNETVVEQTPVNTENTSTTQNVAPSVPTGSPRSSSSENSYNGTTNNEVSSPKTAEEYKAQIAQKENDKNQIKQNTAAGVQEQEQKITAAMTQENSGIPLEAQAEYNEQKAELDGKIGEQETEIEKQKGVIQDSIAKIASCDTAIGQIDEQISSLQTQLADVSSEDPGAKSRIKGKISNLEAKKTKLENEKKAVQTAKEAAESAQKIAEETKSGLEKERDGLLDAILEKYKDVIPLEVKETIETAKAEIQNLKAQETEKISSLNSEIQTLKTELSQLERKQSTDKVIGENTESLWDANGKRIAPIVMPQTPEEWAKYGLTSEGQINAFKKMQPKMQEASINLIDYALAKGYTVKVNSTFRSYAAQAKLYAEDPTMAAAPGTSQHEIGLAIDIRVLNSSGKKDKAAHRMLGAYWESQGHRWLGSRKNNPEDWHFDMKNG